MGYFPGYEMEPCWFCGKSSCNGNHKGEEAERASRQIVWQNDRTRHDRLKCPCANCREYQARRDARKEY